MARDPAGEHVNLISIRAGHEEVDRAALPNPGVVEHLGPGSVAVNDTDIQLLRHMIRMLLVLLHQVDVVSLRGQGGGDAAPNLPGPDDDDVHERYGPQEQEKVVRDRPLPRTAPATS